MSIGNMYEDVHPAILAVGPGADRASVACALKSFAEAGYEALQVNFPAQMSLQQIIEDSRDNTAAVVVMCPLAVGAGADCTDEVRSLLDVQTPGVAELLRVAQLESGYGRGLFERAAAGFVGRCLVFTVPEDSRTAVEAMEEILSHYKGWVLDAPAEGEESELADYDWDDDSELGADHVATVLQMPLPKNTETTADDNG